MIDRTGQQFGQLTILKDGGNAQFLCRCSCNEEELFPRAITKPSYKGRLMCSYCRGSICVICGARIKYISGRQALTCSDKHARQYASEKETARYHRVKHTDEYKKTRAEYFKKLKKRFEENPALYIAYRIKRRASIKKYRSKPEFNQRRNEQIRQFMIELRKDPSRYEIFKMKARKWYQSLTDDEYQKAFGRVRSQIRKRKPTQ